MRRDRGRSPRHLCPHKLHLVSPRRPPRSACHCSREPGIARCRLNKAAGVARGGLMPPALRPQGRRCRRWAGGGRPAHTRTSRSSAWVPVDTEEMVAVGARRGAAVEGGEEYLSIRTDNCGQWLVVRGLRLPAFPGFRCVAGWLANDLALPLVVIGEQASMKEIGFAGGGQQQAICAVLCYSCRRLDSARGWCGPPASKPHFWELS
mmetsp:Transcript_29349/g.94659  ORF Transcript_29349/g.94659 Transcript_29349/m.94659 type:complete len:206 (-) Transcript_29349:104-721(-)